VSRTAILRFAVIVGGIAVLEALCLAGVIDKITMQPPHLIVRDLWRLLVSGRMNAAIVKTLANTLLALGLAVGCTAVAPCATRWIRCSRRITRCPCSPSIRSSSWCSGWATCRRS
jgi:ABC-type nitrate/sulfonate/bicarbonate transport system permease component